MNPAELTPEQIEQVKRGRELLPQSTAFLDQMRSIFGPQCKLEWAEEGRVRFKKRGPEGVVPVLQGKE